MDAPRFLTHFTFWLLLGLLSIFFAAFLSGSAPGFLSRRLQAIQNLLTAGLLVVYTGAGVFLLGASICSLLKRDIARHTAREKINYD